MDQVRAIHRAWSLYRSDSALESYVALAIMLVVVGPAVWEYWKGR